MIELLQGDCTEVLPRLPEASVQAIITSPPYFGLRDYGIPPTHWPEIAYSPLAGLPPIKVPPSVCCLGLEESPLAYIAHLVHVFRLLRPVLRDDGVVWLNLGDSYAQPSKWGGGQRNAGKNKHSISGGYSRARHKTGLKDKDLFGNPWRAALALQADGWYLRADVIWDKSNGMCESVEDRPTRSHEYLFLLAKASRYYYDADAIREPLKPKTLTTYGTRHQGQGNDVTGNVKADNWGKRLQERQPRLNVDGTPAGANRRAIWRIASEGSFGNHYATFPQALVEPCLLAATSPQACPNCGAAWARIYEPTGHVNRREAAHVPGNAATKTDSTGWAPKRRATDRRQPTCRCAENDGAGRRVVLDPFAGTFTVGRVALRYGRHAIGIELNPHYCELAEGRTNGVQTIMEGYL
jgi:DNA modification methylase